MGDENYEYFVLYVHINIYYTFDCFYLEIKHLDVACSADLTD